MTAITSYASLKSNIIDYIKRPDANSKLDAFIALAEERIKNDLRIRQMEGLTTVSTSTSDRFAALPTGYISFRKVTITVDDEDLPLTEKPLREMQVLDSDGVPGQFAVTDQIEFNRTSDQVYTVNLHYYSMPTGLSASNTTNVILDNFPMVYLAGCMVQATHWTKQKEDNLYWEGVYLSSMRDANKLSRDGRHNRPMAYVTGMTV